MAKLLNIAIKSAKRKPMDQLESAFISCEYGLDRDFRGKPGKRQVTVLDINAWNDACEALGKKLSWETRRANLLVDGLNLNNSAGQYILIGQSVLEITQETDPCSRMDEAEPGLFEALKSNWRGGVCCRVVKEGEVKRGDIVKMKTKEEYDEYYRKIK